MMNFKSIPKEKSFATSISLSSSLFVGGKRKSVRYNQLAYKTGFNQKFTHYIQLFYDSTIRYSSIDLLVIALPTLRQQKLLLLTFLNYFCIGFFTLVHGFFSVFLPVKLSLFQLLRHGSNSYNFFSLRGDSESLPLLLTIAFKSKEEINYQSDNYGKSNRERKP